jgi:NADPH:quinone reductase-like Zn-dependent oxidoreductase
MKAGERVLIHSGAGGVGQVAMQLCAAAGARVIATAGTDAKRNLLKRMGAEHVFDSHSLQFEEEVMRVTNGEGVHIALNSLPGEFAEATLRCLGKNGRLMEIGKRDVLSEAHVRDTRPDVNYRIIYLADDMIHNAELVHSLFCDLSARLEKRTLRAPRTSCYPIERILDVFRYMRQGLHIGKLVLFHGSDSRAHVSPEAHAERVFSAQSTVLISGGLGALGIETCN